MTFVTTKFYLSLWSSFRELSFEQLKNIQSDAARMREGLEKIKQARDQVAVMRTKLVEQESRLHDAESEAEQVLEETATT
jgi:hypothetical protein